MSINDIRIYYKNQTELGYALRDYIDAYFQNKIQDEELVEKITLVIDSNSDKFYKGNDIAQKPKQILGKTRLNLLQQILSKKGDEQVEKNSNLK